MSKPDHKFASVKCFPYTSHDLCLTSGSTLMVATYGEQQINPATGAPVNWPLESAVVDFLSLNGDPLPACLNETQPSFLTSPDHTKSYMMKKQGKSSGFA